MFWNIRNAYFWLPGVIEGRCNQDNKSSFISHDHVFPVYQVVLELQLTRREPGSQEMTTSARNSGQVMVRSNIICFSSFVPSMFILRCLLTYALLFYPFSSWQWWRHQTAEQRDQWAEWVKLWNGSRYGQSPYTGLHLANTYIHYYSILLFSILIYIKT